MRCWHSSEAETFQAFFPGAGGLEETLHHDETGVNELHQHSSPLLRRQERAVVQFHQHLPPEAGLQKPVQRLPPRLPRVLRPQLQSRHKAALLTHDSLPLIFPV